MTIPSPSISMVLAAIAFLVSGSGMVAMTWMMWGVVLELTVWLIAWLINHFE